MLEHEIDACAGAASALAAVHEPEAALAKWLHRYTEFLATKRGLAAALHSGDPPFDALPGYFFKRVAPALGSLLEAAAVTGEIRADISPRDLLHAIALLCLPVPGEGLAYSQRMVAVLIDGLRYGTDTSQSRPWVPHGIVAGQQRMLGWLTDWSGCVGVQPPLRHLSSSGVPPAGAPG